GRAIASAEFQQIRTADLLRNPLQHPADRDSLARTDVHRSVDIAVQQGGKGRADVGHVQETAYLSAMGTQRFAFREQIEYHRRHQALRMLARAELKEKPAPGSGQAPLPPGFLERLLQGNLALGI